jgi:uncharacterized membrane protein
LGDIVKQSVIEAPVGKVYDYVVDPHNAPNYISAITKILSGPEGKPAKGDVWRAEANFLNLKHTLNLRLDGAVPDKRVRFVLEGDLEAVLDLRLAPVDNSSDQTSVRMSMDVPSVPGLLLNAMLGGMLTEDMARLKRILET